MDPSTSPRARGRPAEFAIDRLGVWSYRGSPIRREGLLRLLAGMLRRDERGYVLATPEQTLRVEVEDVPFVVTEVEVEGVGEDTRVQFLDGLGERAPLDSEHPLRLRSSPDGTLRPYVLFRNGMEAVLHRNVFYRLADVAHQRDTGGPYGIFSNGLFFPLE